MSTIEDLYDDFINLMKIKRQGHPILFTYVLSQIKNAEATFKTIAADVGSTTATASDDTLTIVGGDNVATSITGNTMTISIGYFMEYKGTHDASTAAYPTSPEQGDVWVASVAGTISGTYYDVNDWMVYNGTSWDKIEGLSKLENDASPKLAAALDANSKKINNLATPAAASDAATKDYVDTLVGAGGHVHDTDTLQLDGINSNGGAFSFNTTGQVTFNQDVSVPNLITAGNVDGIDVSAVSITNMPTAVNNWKMFCTNGSGVMTEIATGASGTILTGNGVAAAPSFQASASVGWASVVSNVANLQTALDAGGIILLKAGTYSITAPLDIDANKSVVLIGEGDETIIDCNGNQRVFNITAADNVVLSNFKIDGSALLTAAVELVNVAEASNNPVLIDNVYITGDGTNGYGIEINSQNCTIRNCRIDNVGVGVFTLSSYSIIHGNNINNCNLYGICGAGGITYCDISNNIIDTNSRGIYFTGGGIDKYINFVNNICINNTDSGIYVDTIQYSNISNNICQNNTLYGIFATTAWYDNYIGNICVGNNINSASNGGGIWFDAQCTYSTISGNECYDNVNTGAGTAYGINIANANCDYLIIKNNRLRNNDIAADDTGGNNTWIFDAFTRQDIEDITTNFSGSCIIHMPNGTTDLGGNTISISGGGSYIIQGQGSSTIIDIGGDVNAFDITSAASCVLRDFKIDATDLTTNTKEIINITEGSNNPIIIDNVTIVGDGTNGYGIECNSNNCIINNCHINNIGDGIVIKSANNRVSNNNCNNNNSSGILLSSATYSMINGNVCYSNTLYGIATVGSNYNIINGNNCYNNNTSSASSGGGIYLVSTSDNNTVSGNNCSGNANGGAGTGYGINIANANCDENLVMSNLSLNNDTNYNDTGTNTFDTDGAAQALNNIA